MSQFPRFDLPGNFVNVRKQHPETGLRKPANNQRRTAKGACNIGGNIVIQNQHRHERSETQNSINPLKPRL